MIDSTRRRVRVLVCGTGFGRIHLRAIAADDDVDLAGILSRGSAASRGVAAEYGVTCHTSVDDLPDDIDIACVVIPSTTGAGEGTEIALRLLDRGIHVLQEGPLLPDEVTRALRLARARDVRYRVNTLYSEIDAVRTLLATADSIRERQQPLFIDAACGIQVLYSLLDLIARCAGAGEGTEIALRLLDRGIHVLQEGPLLPDEVTRALRLARARDVRYRVNTLYSEIDAVRTLLATADSIRERQQPLFIDAACGIQVLYSLLDLIARCAGALRPWRFADPSRPPESVRALTLTEAPFTSIHGVVGGIPVTLRVQNEIDPSDPDNHAMFLHRLSVGFEAGVLALADTHGPVLWSPRLHSARDDEGHLILDGAERLDQVSTVPIGNASPPRFHELFTRVWPQAVARALHRIRDEMETPISAPILAQQAQWTIGVSNLWQDLSARLEPVALISRSEPDVLPLEEVLPE